MINMAIGLIRAVGRMASKNLGKVGGAGNVINGGFGAYFGISGYNTAREEGNGVISSLAAGATEAILPMLMTPTGYAMYVAATELPGVAVSAAESYGQYGRNLARQSKQTPFQNSQFNDTQQTFTMRQAGMALAQKSKYSLQQTTLGNEAQYMHR